MERPTADPIELPLSHFKVRLYTFYTRGETIEVENIMTRAIQFEPVNEAPDLEVTEDGKKRPPKESTVEMRTIDTSYRTKMEDMVTLLAVCDYTDSKGKTEKPSMEWLRDLPNDDFEFIQKSLPKPSKKK